MWKFDSGERSSLLYESPGSCEYVISLKNILAYFGEVLVTKKKY